MELEDGSRSLDEPLVDSDKTKEEMSVTTNSSSTIESTEVMDNRDMSLSPSFLELMTKLENGFLTDSRLLDSVEEEKPASELSEISIKLKDFDESSDQESLPVSPKTSQIQLQKRNSSVLVDEVLMQAQESLQHSGVRPLLPMVVLLQPDSFWVLGEEYEIARDENGFWSAQDVATEHLKITSDSNAYMYGRNFYGKKHENYIGTDVAGKHILMSVCLDNREPYYDPTYRVIIRTEYENCYSEYKAHTFFKDPSPWDFVSLENESPRGKNLVIQKLELVALPDAKELIKKYDEHAIYSCYKFGIMYQKYGQKTENEMFSNEFHSPAMDEFLDMIGDRVKLKGFKRYKAGLDTKDDMTGTESIFTVFEGREIMFHVSTFLPYEPLDRQQIERKRHIGNDVVTIVFQDENTPFCPSSIRSNFLHIFVVIQVEQANADDTIYKVCLVSRKSVERFEPILPVPPVFKKGPEFREFLLTLLINAEISARNTSKFKELNIRTRQQLFVQLVKELYGETSGKKRGRHKSETDTKAKTKRKPSLNFGRFFPPKSKGLGAEYLLSPRLIRKNADEEPTKMGPRQGSYNDISFFGKDHEVIVTPERSNTISTGSTKVSTNSEESKSRDRSQSYGEALVIDQSSSPLDPPKRKKSIFKRMKALSTKKKIRQSVPDGESAILVGLKAKDDWEIPNKTSLVQSLEDVRLHSKSASSSSNLLVARTQRMDHESSIEGLSEEENYPSVQLSQSVPSSPVGGHRPLLHQASCPIEQKESMPLKRNISKQSYSATRRNRVLSTPAVMQFDTNPTIKLSGSPKVEDSPRRASAYSPRTANSVVRNLQYNSHGSPSSLKKQAASGMGSIKEISEVQKNCIIPEDIDGNGTLDLLLKKLEEITTENSRLRHENFQLLKRQALQDSMNKNLLLQKTALERDLALAQMQLERMREPEQ